MVKVYKRHLPEFPYYYGCPKCRSCVNADEAGDYQPLCPSYHYYRTVAASGAGMNKIAVGLFEGLIELDDSVSRIVHTCLHCYGCDVRCPMVCRPERTNLFLRRELIAAGVEPPEPLRRMRERVRRTGTPHGAPRLERWPEGDPEGPPWYIFAGCHVMVRRPELLASLDRIAKALGYRLELLDADGSCCGNTLYQAGYERDAEKAAKRTMRALRKVAGPVTVLDPGCYRHLAVVRRAGELVEFFTTRLLRELGDRPLTATALQVAYHDPCSLGRGCGDYASPRALLALLPGVEVGEFPRQRANAWCCGAGAQMPELDPEFAAWCARERWAEAPVATVVTACTGCADHLAGHAPAEARVVHLLELVAGALPHRAAAAGVHGDA